MAIEPIPVADIQVPQEFARLRDLAYNLWWSWTPEARLLFSNIDAYLWGRYRNPVELLINIEPHHWDRLLNGGGNFMSQYRKVIRDFDRYMNPDEPTWFQQQYPEYKSDRIAYFSTEFGLHESLGIYCGGLGVLSGDHAKAASDLGIPFVGVGVLYRKGYFHQAIDLDGRQHHIYNNFDFYRLPLRPMHNAAGRDLVVTVDYPDRQVYARVWQLAVGRVQLYLLDTDILENDPGDRPMTSQLYVRGREMRLCQEIMLGIGGVRALQELKIQPAVWHMNEGHSAFQVVERMRAHLAEGMTWKEASEAIRVNTLFTTHTPVPAGNEAFEASLVEKYMRVFTDKMGVDVHQMLDLGKSYPEGGSQPFNLTAVGLRFSHYSNGVSKLHGEVANHMWHHLYPGAKPTDQNIKSVTNGVHITTWLGHDIRTIIEEALGTGWIGHEDDPEFWKGILKIRDKDLWAAHQSQKDRMIRLVRHRLVEQFARHGKGPDSIREMNRMLDPNVLTIGFARRFATYKRAGLIFRDYDRLRQIITNAEHPVQIVFSGKAHPADEPGQDLIRDIVTKAIYSDLKGYIFFVEDYDIRIARHLVQGVDVWMNTPRRPREASGTSGMKAAINGALNFSVSDGWWPEAHNGKNGWIIGSEHHIDNEDEQDYRDSTSLYDILQNQIIPLYYQNRTAGCPCEWVQWMKESMATIIPGFSAARMLQDYTRDAYMPTAQR
ncbi:MAG TPA: alpha-glucan family phosphorylase [Kiritimatiellia bacterium]|nr:alpha-glucan family phosphorylase [Kiritimatiellia bacterium]